MTGPSRKEAIALAVYCVVAGIVSILIVLFLALNGCGRRPCDEAECTLTRNAAGNVIERTCPEDCEP